MNIGFKNDFEREFMDLKGGQSFVYKDKAYMKLDSIYETDGGYEMFNAVNLVTGELNYFNSDDWVKTLQFNGEWYIG